MSSYPEVERKPQLSADQLILATPLCKCGCGEKVAVSRFYPRKINRYIKGHRQRGHVDRCFDMNGRPRIWKPDHPKASTHGFMPEHIVLAETALGRFLPEGAEVHHFDENKSNNGRGNLVICQDKKYHWLLHVRRRAQLGCGNPNWRKCWICKQWDDPNYMARKDGYPIHRDCYNDYQIRSRILRKQKIPQ